jgi:hypothetical protein
MKLVKTPKLKTGDDAEAAKQLTALYQDAQDGVKRIIVLGLFCYSVKARLSHGQFQSWLTANCPSVPYRTLSRHMVLANSALESCGIKIKALNSKVPQWHFSHCGEILALPDSKIPEAAKPLREKLSSLIEGKSARQLFGEFKQAEEEPSTGQLKPKVGRLKGQGGATREQRASARAEFEKLNLESLELQTESFTDWINENADAKHLGQIDDQLLVKFKEALLLGVSFCNEVIASRKGGRK